MGKKDEAVEIFNDMLEQARAFYCGKPHLTLVEALVNVGVVSHPSQDVDFEKCLQYFQEALELMNGIFGPNHAHSLTSGILRDIAWLYYDFDDFPKAQQYLRDALNMESVICGENDVNDTMAAVCSNLGRVAEKMGNLSQAKEYYSEAVQIRNKLISLGKTTDFDLFDNLYKLSLTCEALGEEDEAFKLLQEAVEIEKVSGSEDWQLWDDLIKLNVQFEIGSFAKLLTLFQDGVEVAKNTSEKDCPPESLKYLKLLKQL